MGSGTYFLDIGGVKGGMEAEKSRMLKERGDMRREEEKGNIK